MVAAPRSPLPRGTLGGQGGEEPAAAWQGSRSSVAGIAQKIK